MYGPAVTWFSQSEIPLTVVNSDTEPMIGHGLL
jgi:hypothetical protein